MREGIITCTCGQVMGISTVGNSVTCPGCNTEHSVMHIPHTPEIVEIPKSETQIAIETMTAIFNETVAKLMNGGG